MQSGSSSLPGAKVRDAPAVKMRSPGPTNPPIRTGAHDARRFLAPPHHGWGGGAICPLIPSHPLSLVCHFGRFEGAILFEALPIHISADWLRIPTIFLPGYICLGLSAWILHFKNFLHCLQIGVILNVLSQYKEADTMTRASICTHMAVPCCTWFGRHCIDQCIEPFQITIECILPNAKRKQQPRWEPPFGASTLHWGICGIYHPFITFWGWPRYISQHSYINQHRALAYHISIWSDVAHQVCCGLCIVHCALWIMDCARLMIKLSFSPPRWRSQSQTLSPANRKLFPKINRKLIWN